MFGSKFFLNATLFPFLNHNTILHSLGTPHTKYTRLEATLDLLQTPFVNNSHLINLLVAISAGTNVLPCSFLKGPAACKSAL